MDRSKLEETLYKTKEYCEMKRKRIGAIKLLKTVRISIYGLNRISTARVKVEYLGNIFTFNRACYQSVFRIKRVFNPESKLWENYSLENKKYLLSTIIEWERIK